MASRSTRSRRPTTPKQQPEPQSRAKWTASLTKVLADLMVDQVHKGNKHNNTFGKKAWEFICEEFHNNTGLNWDKEQLKNRFSVLRKQYVITKSLLDEPDFKWDEQTGAIMATNEAWNKYIPVCYFCCILPPSKKERGTTKVREFRKVAFEEIKIRPSKI